MSALLRLAIVCAIVLCVGCSGGTVKITGKILKAGAPMIVSEDTYVTLQFVLESKSGDAQSQSKSAKFDQKTGTYSIELPAGKYSTNLVIAPPSKDGKLAKPPKPVKSTTVYDLTKSQTLDVEIP
jgi:hypothetical protein